MAAFPSALRISKPAVSFHLLFVFETGLCAHRPHEGHRDISTVQGLLRFMRDSSAVGSVAVFLDIC
jgi:hypothetical protein